MNNYEDNINCKELITMGDLKLHNEEQCFAEGSSQHISNILSREDFINEMKSEKQYIQVLQQLHIGENVKMPGTTEKVKGFDEYWEWKKSKQK